MSSSVASRLVLRQSAPIRSTLRSSRRYASTTEKATEKASEAASKAKETASNAASNVQSKASEGLSKVQSSAGSAASKVSDAANQAGGRVARLYNSVTGLIPQVTYYSKVGLEVAKIVARGQKMAIPSGEQFSTAFQPIVKAARNPSSILQSAQSAAANTNPENVLSRVRNMDRAQWASAGVVFAEILGFFAVGEMIGRMKVVGYHGEVHHGH